MSKIHRNNCPTATILEKYPLTKSDSTKQTWHVALDLKNCPIEFHPGDSVGIFAQNDPTLVQHLIEAMGASPEVLVTAKRTGQEMPLAEFLTSHANLARITSAFCTLLYEETSCEKLEKLLSDRTLLKAYLGENDPLSLLQSYAGHQLSLQTLCELFGPLLPRFYSVASSKKTHPERLDLTVALYTWTLGGEKRYGVASHFLCHLAEEKTTPIPLYVQPAPHFRLPEDHSRDIIMVGPGTGIAPFRAFMQERTHHGASGKHWLFFGERNAKSDFFYEEEWQGHDSLRLHTAFSRDQDKKLYVQDRMKEHAEELFSWLEGGAHLYVCGDAKVMAKDVEKTLKEILAQEGGLGEDEAKGYLKTLKREGRYLLDVY